MKKSRILVLGAAVAAFALAAVAHIQTAVASVATNVAESASEFTLAAKRIVVGAIVRAVVEFAAMSGGPVAAHLTTKTPAFTGQLPIRVMPMDQGDMPVPIPFDFPAANVVVNDILALVQIPAGVDIVDWDLIVNGQVDSNGVPTLAFTLGSLTADLSNINTTYAAGLTAGRGAQGDTVRQTNGAALGEGNAVARFIGIKWTAAAATYVAGKKGVLVLKVRG